MYVDNKTVQLARNADLYAFLLGRHGDLFTRCGHSIYMKQNNSLYIKSGFYGYRDFSTGETGNGIDFLTRHLGYSFQEAVLALSGSQPVPSPVPVSLCEDTARKTQKPFPLPIPAPLPHKRMFAYLMSRGIPGSAIRYLASMGLIYQEEGTGNIVFINKEKDYCELRGTYTYAEKQFHGCRKIRSDRFWYFIPEAVKPLRVFITESAIDAISLWILQKDSMNIAGSVYASIGGAANYSTIERISRNIDAIIATDNDSAGDMCRTRFHKLRSITPVRKDWNEDLQNLNR